MKKTGKIWLLSIIPGLGHFILGDVRMGVLFLASIILLGFSMFFSPSETVFMICLVLGIIVWSYQWVHAVTMAGRKYREASGWHSVKGRC